MDDGEAEEDEKIVDDQENEGDADASDAKRKGKQEEEVGTRERVFWCFSLPPVFMFQLRRFDPTLNSLICL